MLAQLSESSLPAVGVTRIVDSLISNNVVLWVLFSFSQLQLKNLHEDLSGRLEESLSIINEKVPFNDTSRYYINVSFCYLYL